MLPFSFFDAHCDTLSCCTHLGWNMADSPGQTDLRRGADCARHAVDAATLIAPGIEQVDGGLKQNARHQAEQPVAPAAIFDG